jgi:hypothetical protein
MAAEQSTLFKPITVGSLSLQHRIVMAPLTRMRSTADHVPLDMVAEMYEQRSRTPGPLPILLVLSPSCIANALECTPRHVDYRRSGAHRRPEHWGRPLPRYLERIADLAMEEGICFSP